MSGTKGTSREARLRELRRRFLVEAEGDQAELLRLAGLERLSPDDARRARKLAHDLRGSGGSYGFPEVSAAAGAVEDAFLGGVPAARVAPLVTALGEALARAIGAMA